MVLICLAAPVKNMAYSIPLWWKAISNFDYPKKNIHIVLAENDSIDSAPELLSQIKKKHEEEYGSFKIFNLNFGMHHVRFWEERSGESDLWKFVKAWLFIHNDIFIQYAKDHDCKYILEIHPDVELPANTIKSFLNVYEKFDNASYVSAPVNRRGTSDYAVFKLVKVSIPKPHRIFGDAFNETETLRWMPVWQEFAEDVYEGLQSVGNWMIPTELNDKHRFTYHPDDINISYQVKARREGYIEYLDARIRGKHHDRPKT